MNNRIVYTPKQKRFIKKRKRHMPHLAIMAVFFIALCIGLFFTMRARALQISHISIKGLDTIREEDIKNTIVAALSGSYAGGLIPYRFIMATPKDIITKHLKEQFISIAEVDIETRFPNKLIVAINEHKLFGIVCNDALDEETSDQSEREIMCAYLDTNGIAYQKAPKTQGFLITKISLNIPEISLSRKIIDNVFIRRIEELNTTLPRIIGPIASYKIERPASHELSVITKQGFSLILKDEGDVHAMLYILKTVLEKEIGARRNRLNYIDMRFGNKVFYKFK